MGKSTLIKILNGEILPDSGHIEIGETVKIGCFSQDDSHMHPDMRAIDYVKEASDYIETADGTKISASQMCEKFLFNSTMQYSFIGNLSGGERRRLHLLRTLMLAPNVLLLDEPTNDLDIATLNILEDYLDAVSYTHLDVYKRQKVNWPVTLRTCKNIKYAYWRTIIKVKFLRYISYNLSLIHI